MDSLKQKSMITIDHKQKTDKENNIIDEFYRVNRRVKGYGFTINLFRTTSKMIVDGRGMKDFMEHILPAISASVKDRKEALDKLDTELEKALKHTSTITEAEECHNTDNPVRLGTNQANTEVQTPECAIQVTSSKIIEITHEKQNLSGQTNSINSLQGKLKQQGSKMTSSKNSETMRRILINLSRILHINQIRTYMKRKRNNESVKSMIQEKLRGTHRKITCMKRNSNVVT